MWKRNRILGLVCAVAMAVYSGRAVPPGVAASADPTTPIVATYDRRDPFQRTRLATNNTRSEINAIIADAVISPAVADPSSADSSQSPVSHTGVSMTNTQVTVSDAGTIQEMHANDTDLLSLLRMLSLKMNKNIIASKGVDGRVTANLYNVTCREALDAILQPNGYVCREKGNFIYVYTPKELADLDKASRVMGTEVFHLYYTPAANAASMIKPVLSPDSQVAVTTASETGIDLTGTGHTGGNSHATEDMLVVTDYSDNLEKARKVIKEVDRRPQEVLVEATILQATLSDNNSLGVDFSVLGGVKFDQFLSTPSQIIQNAANGGLQSVSKNPGDVRGLGGYGVGETNFTSALPPGGMRVGLLTNNISVFVQALESVTNTTVLANPKVLSLDKQEGYVLVGRHDGYQTTTVSSTTSTQTVQFNDTGTKLAFRPFIGDDGYVRMEIHPEDSIGGLTAANLPFSTSTEVTTNLMVKDGNTIVIGGLFRDSSTVNRGQVPFLGNIPLLGVLFRQEQDQSQRQEIIILLTPHIIKDDSAYAKVSQADQKRVEELRVGVRKGMMIFGRERLAELAYENAVAEAAKPHPDTNLVLWHLNIATDLNPTFLEAIEMKEKVSGKQVTDVDNSSIRSFVSRSILADQTPLPPPSETVNKTRPATTPVTAPSGK